MKKSKLYFNIVMTTECPNCKEDIDLTDDDYNFEGQLSEPFFWGKGKPEINFEFECNHCLEDFHLKDLADV